MPKLYDSGTKSIKPYYRVTPIWENQNGDQFSYGEEVFTERTLDEVMRVCERIEGRDYFKVELIQETRILTVIDD